MVLLRVPVAGMKKENYLYLRFLAGAKNGICCGGQEEKPNPRVPVVPTREDLALAACLGEENAHFNADYQLK